MSQLVALSLSIGILGGIATGIFLSVPGLLIWAAFIAWACYFHNGGNNEALKTTIIGNIFGAVVAWVAAFVLISMTPGGTLWAAIVVGVTVLVLCLAAHVKALASIPSSVYGYASVFAYLLGNPTANLTKEALTSASLQNALIAVAVSMVIGAIFGMVSGKVGAALTK